MHKVVVKDDESALALLEEILRKPDAPVPEVEFEGWPRFEMHVKGERYHSTITPELMESFLDLQKTINKSFALVRYADSSRRLTNPDREELKILVEVKDGSSGFIANLEEQAGAIAAGICEGFKSMDSKHKLLAVLALGTMGFSYLSFSAYVDSQKEVRLAEISKLELEAERHERMHTLEMVQGMTESQAARYADLFGMVTERIPQMQTVSEHMAGTYSSFVSSTKDAEQISINGVSLPGAFVSEISNTPRNSAVEDRIASVYRINGVDHRSGDEYKLSLYDVIRRVEINATLPKDGSFVTDAILDIIQEAEWGGKVVLLQLVTKTRAGKLIKAEIEKVTQITDQEKYGEGEQVAALDKDLS